ncbi:transmembrane protein, putative (macronuclear) [Tetrahymena thermophila SB210]|uniref:Transmembrane protein, putative n=1 Tax=Tetrahymena thermophila (strain SB210) TaxID=312017 RepID=W7XE91_TETTS|nr:transmembrane protein, putative [Tetrahymena thermophila SB210]EWS75982.1 transmembrane protein, putative [Tetrahymena thermophila SB210]|eukprot:XP_012651500.1 transmembrane protein, putative [Tetrahymena thermophila SB210]
MRNIIDFLLKMKILLFAVFIQKLQSQNCPVEYFGQIQGYSCLTSIQSHLFLKSNPSLSSEDIIYTSNYNVLTQINLMTSKTIQTISTNNNANIIYMTNQDSLDRSVLIIADTSGCIIEIDVELNAEIQRYQLNPNIYTFDSTINIDYESQTIITYKGTTVFFINYNTQSVFQPNIVGNKYVNSILIQGVSSILLNMSSKAYICDLIKNTCKSLSLPNISAIYFFNQNGNFFAVYATGSQGNSITLFTINKTQMTTSRTSYMTIPISINNMVLDVSNPQVQYAITIGQFDCRVFNFNTKQMQVQINLMSNQIDVKDTTNPMTLASAQAALLQTQFNNIYLSGSNLVITSNNFVILINYLTPQQPTVTSIKYINLINNLYQNVYILPASSNNNIVLVGDKTLVYLYNPSLQIYILNSCISTYSLDSQIQSQLIQDDAQNSLLSLNSQGISYQWNKLNGKVIYQIATLPPGSLFKLSIALSKIVYYNFQGFSIYDNVTKQLLVSNIINTVQDVQFDETNFFIYLAAGNNLILYPVNSSTLILGNSVQQTGTSQINQMFVNPPNSQILVVRSSQAILYNVTATKIAVNTTIVDNFIQQLYDINLNILIAYTQTASNFYIKTYAFPSSTMVQFVNDPTLTYSMLRNNPSTQIITMYIKSKNQIIGWSYNQATPSNAQLFMIKGLINQIQFYFIDTVGANNFLVLITVNGLVLVYNADTQDIKYQYTVHNQLAPLNYYPDQINKFVITYAQDNRLVKYDYANGRLVKQWMLSSVPIGFTADYKNSMIFVGQKNQIYSLSYQGQDMLQQIVGFQSSTVPGILNQQIGQFVSTNNNLVRVYSIYTFQQVAQLAQVHTQPILYMSFASSLNLIILCSQDQTCSVWSSINFQIVQTLQLNQSTPVQFTCNVPTGLVFQQNNIYIMCQTGIVIQWVINANTNLFQFQAFFTFSTNPIQSTQSYQEQGLLISLDTNSQGSVQYINSQTIAFTVQGDKSLIDKTNQLFITFGKKGIVLQYNLQGSLVFNYTVHNGNINQVFIDAPGQQLISIGDDNNLNLYSNYAKASFSILQSYTHTAPLKTGIFDSQANLIVVGDSLGSILFFNYPLLGLKQIIYQAHQSQIINLILNRITNTLISFGSDNNVSLWNYYAYFKTDFRIMIFQEGSIQDGFLSNQQAITIQQNGMLKMWDFNLQYQMYMQKLQQGQQDYNFKLTNLPQLGKILVNSIAQVYLLSNKTYQIINQVQNTCNSIKTTTNTNNLFMIFCINKNQINVFGENLQLTSSQPTHSITSIFIFTGSQINEVLNEFAAYTSNSQIVIWKFTSLGVFSSSPLIINITPTSQIYAMFYIQISSTQYNILACTYIGNILVFSYDTVNTPQFQLELDQANNQRQIVLIQQVGNQVFFKRFGLPFVQVYSTTNWSNTGFLVTPCIGYQNRLDYDIASDLICLTCFGQYNVYTFSSLTLIGNLRIISEFSLYGDQSTSNNDDLRIVNGQYIIHARLLYIFIFQVNRSQNTITYLGKIQQVYQFSKVLSFTVNQQPTYTEVEYVFVGTKVSKLQFLLQGSTACKQSTNIQNLKQTFVSLVDITNRLSTFFVMTNFQFYVSLNNNQALPQLPQFPFASQSSLYINYNNSQVIQTSSFHKFYSSVNGFISVNLMNLNLTFEKQIGQTGVQQLPFFNITSVSIINCSFQNLSGVIFSFQQVSNIELSNILIYNQTIQSVVNPTSSSISQYFFSITNATSIKISNLNITNSQFISSALLSINNFGYIQNQASQIANQGLVTVNGLYLQNNTIQFSNLASFIDMLFMSQVVIKDLIFIGNNNTASSIPFMIPLLLNLQLCNLKQLQNIQFISNKDFLLLGDNNYFNNKMVGTNTTQYYASQIDDYLQVNIINITQNIFTDLSSNSNQYSNLIQSFSDNISLIGMIAIKNTCTLPCFVNSILDIESSKNSSLSGLQSFKNIGFKQAVIVINNSTMQGSQWSSNQNNCSQSGSFLLQNSNGTITVGQFTGNKCSADNCGAAIFLNKYSNLILNQVNFIENHSLQYGGAISQIVSCSLQIIQAVFDSNNSIQEGGAIFSYQSALNISKANFTNNKSGLNGGAIYLEMGSLILQQCYFIKNSAQNSGGGAYILNTNSAQLTIINANQNSAQSSGGCLFVQRSHLNLDDSDIENNVSMEGGALQVNSLLQGSKISSTKFIKNKVNGSGGAIRMDNSDCQVQNCIFQGNIAGAGGAIRYTTLKPQFMLPLNGNSKLDSCNSFGQNTCQNNQAICFGANICSYPNSIKLLPGQSKLQVVQANQSNSYYQIQNIQSGVDSVNIQYQLLDEFGDPIKFQDINIPTLSQNSLRNLKDFELQNRMTELLDSQKISQSLFLELDSYKSFIQTDQPSNIEQKNLLILRDYITRYQDSQFVIEGIDIIGSPLKTATFKLIFQGINTFHNDKTLQSMKEVDIQISFRGCKQGEAYTKYCDTCKLGYCQPCQSGSYILDPPSSTTPQNCTVCNKPFAASCSKSTIHLLPGYWRENNMTDVVAECNQKFGLCIGNDRYGYCKQGYTGPICETCDQFAEIWGKSYGNYDILEMKLCMTCDNLKQYIPGSVIYGIIICCLIVVLMNDANSKMINSIQSKLLSRSNILHLGITSFTGKTLIIFKICIFYMQILTALVKFDIIFENSLKIAKFIPIYLFSPIISMEFWFDCVLSNIDIGVSIQYMRLIWSLILYLMIFTFSMIIYIVFAAIIYKNYKYEQKIYVTIKYFSINFFIFAWIYFFYIMQHSLLQNFMKILSCKQIANTEYIVGQLNKVCNDFEHSMWQILFIIPVFTIVGYVIPFCLFYHIHLNKFNLYKPTKIFFIRKYGFLYFEYKPKYWYWELLKLQLRTLIVIFLNAYEEDIKKKGCFILVILIIYSLLAQKNQPYQLPQMNSLDKRSSIISAFLVWLALVSNNNSDEGQTNFFLTIMAIAIILFIINFILQILKDFYNRNEYFIAKSRPVQFFVYYAGYFLPQNIFYARNKLLIKLFPQLYRIIHCQHLIGFDHIQRWRFLRTYIMDFGRRRRRDQYAQFYVYLNKSTQASSNNQSSQNLSSKQKLIQDDQKINDITKMKSIQKKDQIRNSKKSQKGEDPNLNRKNSSKFQIESKKSIKNDEQGQIIEISSNSPKQQQLILKKATSIGEEIKEKQDNLTKVGIIEKTQDFEQIDDDDRDDIIKKIYPIKRPIMCLSNAYSGMKIDNYKDAQIKDLCENPFYYHDYSVKYKFDKEQNKQITAQGEEEIKDLRYKICLNNQGNKQENAFQQNQDNAQIYRLQVENQQIQGQQNVQETPQEYEVSMQDLSDIMSEDYNTRQIQEFQKKPIKESELINFSQDRNLEMIYSPNSNSIDYGQSDFRLQSPHSQQN